MREAVTNRITMLSAAYIRRPCACQAGGPPLRLVGLRCTSRSDAMAEARYTLLTERGVLAVSGPDRRAFLQGLVSNDVGKVSADQARYAALLTAQGRYLHDFMMVEQDETLLLEGERARLADLRRRLSVYRLRAKVALDERADLAVAAAFGSGALARLQLRRNRAWSAALARVWPLSIRGWPRSGLGCCCRGPRPAPLSNWQASRRPSSRPTISCALNLASPTAAATSSPKRPCCSKPGSTS